MIPSFNLKQVKLKTHIDQLEKTIINQNTYEEICLKHNSGLEITKYVS